MFVDFLQIFINVNSQSFTHKVKLNVVIGHRFEENVLELFHPGAKASHDR